MKRRSVAETVVNGAVTLPKECTCIWCGGKMSRVGANFMGSGVNQFALWCDNCGAVLIHAHEQSKRITGFKVDYEAEPLVFLPTDK